MSDADLQRVQADLDTMRQAAGVELPLGWEDVWLTLLASGTGLTAVLWTLLVPGRPAHWGLIPMLLVAIGGTIRLRVKYRRGSGRSPARRWEYTLGLILAGVAGVVMLVYRIWASRLGMPFRNVQAIAIFFGGLALVMLSLTHRWRMVNIVLAVPLMICALAMPFVSLHPVTMFGFAMFVGGAAVAGVEAYQLKRAAVSGHVPH